MKNKKNKNCVMCGTEPDLLQNPQTNEIFMVYFVAPQTDEILCRRCNAINDNIAFEKDSKLRGKKILEKQNETI